MNKKSEIKFRCTPLEKAIISKKASHSGMSVSSYCRNSSLDQKIHYKLSDEELSVYQMLFEYRTNFIRISNILKKKDSNFYKEVKSLKINIKLIS